MKKKPSWFRLIDAVTIAGPGLVTAGLTVYAMIHGYEGPPSSIPGLWAVTIGFIGIWLRWCQLRKADLDTFVWYPTYGIMIKPETYILPSAAEVDALVKKVIDAWTPIYPNAGSIIADQEVIWAFFKKDLNENDKNPAKAKVKGVTLAYSWTMEVDYDVDTEALSATALAHELGHVIIGHATNNWDQAWQHALMQEHNLL